MGKALTDAQIAAYRQDGYLFPLRAYSPEQMAELCRRAEAFERELGQPLGDFRLKIHLVSTLLNELVRCPAILDAVEDLIGPDILCWNTHFFTKAPGSAEHVAWHQDGTYWGLDRPDVVTAWLAFRESTAENGALRVIPGTHREKLPHVDTPDTDNLLSRHQKIDAPLPEDTAVTLLLQPGEFSLHHVLMVHGSEPNRSTGPRMGLAIRYVAAHVKQTAGTRDSATLVRGENRYGHFELEPAPTRDLDPAVMDAHRQLTERQSQILYRDTGAET